MSDLENYRELLEPCGTVVASALIDPQGVAESILHRKELLGIWPAKTFKASVSFFDVAQKAGLDSRYLQIDLSGGYLYAFSDTAGSSLAVLTKAEELPYEIVRKLVERFCVD